MSVHKRSSKKLPRWFRWLQDGLQKLMALLALVNFGLVMFDLTYITWRDFYFRRLPNLIPDFPDRDVPNLTKIYDPVKGIQPNRDTERYLNAVNALEARLRQVEPTQVEAALNDLQQKSSTLMNQIANQTSLQRRLESRLRDRYSQLPAIAVPKLTNVREALRFFWSDTHIREVGWADALYFFDDRLRPLLEEIPPSPLKFEYLDAVDSLNVQVATLWLSPPPSQELLESLRTLSVEMIEDNPFEVANKSGTLEKVKNNMRDRIYTEDDSAKEAFGIFWSSDHLVQQDWHQEVEFFNNDIKPLIATNYFRGIGENGKMVDYFWALDVWFALIFATDILVRGIYRTILKRDQLKLQWYWYEFLLLIPVWTWLRDAYLRRWYDIFLLLPAWRWLRAVPTTIRLSQANLLDLEPVRAQLSQDLIANFAAELTEVVVIRVLTQIQETIADEDMLRSLLNPEARPYIDINDVNEVEEITQRLIQVTVYQVLPKIQPDLQALIRHSIDNAINQSAVYQGLQRLPATRNLPAQLSDRLAGEIVQGLYTAIQSSLKDEAGSKLVNQIATNFGTAFRTEFQKQDTLQEMQSLIYDFLEEVKINYVRRATQEDFEEILKEAEQLYAQASQKNGRAAGRIVPLRARSPLK